MTPPPARHHSVRRHEQTAVLCRTGGANDPAAGEPQVLVPFQEEVHHPQREEKADNRLCSALPLPHTHQWKRTLHQVTAAPLQTLHVQHLAPLFKLGISASGPSRLERIPATSTRSFASFSRWRHLFIYVFILNTHHLSMILPQESSNTVFCAGTVREHRQSGHRLHVGGPSCRPG